MTAEELIALARQHAHLPDERSRYTCVTVDLHRARNFGFGDTLDDRISRAAGYAAGIDDYWAVFLSEPTSIDSFARQLSLLGNDPREPDKPINRFRRPLIDKALKSAQQEGYEFFVGERTLRPREAAEWFAAMPRWRDLLPTSLQAWISAHSGKSQRTNQMPEQADPHPRPTVQASAEPITARHYGPEKGQTNTVEQQRRKLIPRLQQLHRKSESRSRTYTINLLAKTVTLPGTGSDKTKNEELLRVWGKIDPTRREGGK